MESVGPLNALTPESVVINELQAKIGPSEGTNQLPNEICSICPPFRVPFPVSHQVDVKVPVFIERENSTGTVLLNTEAPYKQSPWKVAGADPLLFCYGYSVLQQRPSCIPHPNPNAFYSFIFLIIEMGFSKRIRAISWLGKSFRFVDDRNGQDIL